MNTAKPECFCNYRGYPYCRWSSNSNGDGDCLYANECEKETMDAMEEDE